MSKSIKRNDWKEMYEELYRRHTNLVVKIIKLAEDSCQPEKEEEKEATFLDVLIGFILLISFIWVIVTFFNALVGIG